MGKHIENEMKVIMPHVSNIHPAQGRRPRIGTGGFTLVELMMASFIAVMVISMFMGSFFQQRQVFRRQQMVTEMQQNGHYALESICRDLRMCGYGLNIGKAAISDWIPGLTSNPAVTYGATGDSDSIVIAAAFNPAVATLAVGADTNSTTLTVAMTGSQTAADMFGPTDKRVIFLGKSETLRITAINGNILTISSSPTATQGTEYGYAAGDSIEIVSQVEYRWSAPKATWLADYPHLSRIDTMVNYSLYTDTLEYGTAGYDFLQVTAAYVEDLQIVDNGSSFEVTLSMRTAHPDAYYTHPALGDNFRRVDFSSMVTPRN